MMLFIRWALYLAVIFAVGWALWQVIDASCMDADARRKNGHGPKGQGRD
jgi:hypothetical protein